MFHYYVYYRVDPAHLLEADDSVQQIQLTIASHFGITSRLLKKRDEPLLWMEIYENVTASEAFEIALKQAEQQSGILTFVRGDGQRHLECFIA